MPKKKPKTPKGKQFGLIVQAKPIAKPANHFAVSYAGEDFVLDIYYVHPRDLHIAKEKDEQGVPAVITASVAFNYAKALELKERLAEMITSYERQKK